MPTVTWCASTGAGYKRYSAALWTDGEEILHRMGFGPSALEHWAMNYSINA
jgi:hypothetical protein